MVKLECPHCRYANYIEPDELDWEEDAEKDITCKDCDKIFNVRTIKLIDFICEEKWE